MPKLDQTKTPYLDALKEFVSKDVLPLDVPGHHMGNVKNKLKEFIGDELFRCDINAPIGMDNLANPHGCLLEAEKLLADFTGAKDAFFLINGTSSGIIAMIMTTCMGKDKIILPRNVHKSIVSALVISGATPVYVMPQIDTELEIANQPSVEDYVKAMDENPTAKAVFVINPTYFGAVADLKQIVKEAHKRGMAVLTDEAHGAHYYFDKFGPISGMAAGADMSAVSFHKTGGSLTQSSVLLLNSKTITRAQVQKALNFINTTSPSTILMASLDAARQYAATEGQKNMENVHKIADYAREQINKINGFVACSEEHFKKHGSYCHDQTKLVIKLEHLDINGFELYHILKDEYEIQVELAETYVIMAILAIGTNKKQMVRFIEALKDVSKKHYNIKFEYKKHKFNIDFPEQITKPRTAYHAPSKIVPLQESNGRISKESIMIYPPGIPLIVPGEVFNEDLIERIEDYEKLGVTILSDFGGKKVNTIDANNWDVFKADNKKLIKYFDNLITTPIEDGYSMPFEGNKHSGTIVLLPSRDDSWREEAKPARENYKQIIYAISKFEPVFVGIFPGIYDKVIKDYQGKKNIFPIKIKYNGAWARDNCPIFVTKDKQLRSVDFRFNAWGGKVDGLYDDWQDDDKLSYLLSRRFGVTSYKLADFILEGGSIHVDGEGTCLTTKACLLSKGRNPKLSQKQIEEKLKEYLGVRKVIWLENGIVEDETNEHVDNMCCFIKPGVVALAWTNDVNDPQYKNCEKALKVLESSKDAEGRTLKVVKVLLPKPIYMTKEEAEGIKKGNHNAKERLEGSRLAASYINFYQGDKFVILPAFGVKEDAKAYEQFKMLFPDKQIIQINSKEVLLGGGNIHCITMQIPFNKEFKKKNEN